MIRKNKGFTTEFTITTTKQRAHCERINSADEDVCKFVYPHYKHAPNKVATEEPNATF
jgi:hypothetical protein